MIELLTITISLLWGSFANALIYRLPLRISLLNPKRSICPECKSQIKWYDNVPVLSWVFLRGKCRDCKTRISVTYPLVEILHALFAVLALKYFGLSYTGILIFFLLSILLIITVIDLRHMIIPDRINKPGIIFGLIIGLVNQYYPVFGIPFSSTIVESFTGLAFGFGLLYLIAWIYFKITGVSGLGGGDIKLMGFMGALLGPYCVVPILMTASFTGSIIGIALLFFRKSNFRTEFPFGPWLALGIALYVFGFDAMTFIQKVTEQLLFPSIING